MPQVSEKVLAKSGLSAASEHFHFSIIAVQHLAWLHFDICTSNLPFLKFVLVPFLQFLSSSPLPTPRWHSTNRRHLLLAFISARLCIQRWRAISLTRCLQQPWKVWFGQRGEGGEKTITSRCSPIYSLTPCIYVTATMTSIKQHQHLWQPSHLSRVIYPTTYTMHSMHSTPSREDLHTKPNPKLTSLTEPLRVSDVRWETPDTKEGGQPVEAKPAETVLMKWLESGC